MAVCGMSLPVVSILKNVSVLGGSESSVADVNLLPGSTASFPRHKLSVSSTRRSGSRVIARQGMESSTTGVPAVEEFRLTDARLYPHIASPRSQEFDLFQARGWSDPAWDQGLAEVRAREVFVSGGNITESNMERLIESLVSEEGQSAEDHRIRAVLFDKIADFFSERRAFNREKVELSSSASKAAPAVQLLVDQILADDGRSAMDYNFRAQLFATSAAAFPFKTEK